MPVRPHPSRSRSSPSTPYLAGHWCPKRPQFTTHITVCNPSPCLASHTDHGPRKRLLLWILLAISSIPLHLFYNSAVFSTLSARQYNLFTVSPNLAAGEFFNTSGVPPTWNDDGDGYLPWNYTEILDMQSPNHSRRSIEYLSDRWTHEPFSQPALVNYGSHLLHEVKNQSVWQRLENAECIKQYGQEFVSSRGDLLVVSHALNDSFSIKWLGLETANAESVSQYVWMCDRYPEGQFGLIWQQCHLSAILQNAADWTIRSDNIIEGLVWAPHLVGSRADPVDYCLSRRVEERCRLQFSPMLLIMVIICNAIKAACMCLMIYQPDSEPLVTLGDALASFLDEPDPTTQGNCTATKTHFMSRTWTKEPKPWVTQQQLQWFKNASWKRWLICNLL